MEIRDLGIFLDYFGKVHHRTMRLCAAFLQTTSTGRFGKGNSR